MSSCSICTENYTSQEKNIPHVLPCGHTFCRYCLTHVDIALNVMHCPICRQKIVIGAKFFPINYALAEACKETKDTKDTKDTKEAKETKEDIVPWYNHVNIGDIIDVKGCLKIWIPAEIINKYMSLVRVHYLCWPDEYDEWVKLDIEHTACLGTHTNRQNLTIYKVDEQVEIYIALNEGDNNKKWHKCTVYYILGDDICVHIPCNNRNAKLHWVIDPNCIRKYKEPSEIKYKSWYSRFFE